MDINKLTEDARVLFNELGEQRAAEKPDLERMAAIQKELDELKPFIEIEKRNIAIDAYWKNNAPVNEAPGKETTKEKDGPKNEYRSLGEMLQDVHTSTVKGHMGEKLQRSVEGMSITTDADGGYGVHPEFIDDITSKRPTGKLAPYCTNIPISSNRLIVTRLDESSRVDGSRQGGVRVYSAVEGASATKSKHALNQDTIEAFKAIGLCYTTDELLEDQKALGSILSNEFNKEMGFYQDMCILRGDGTTQAQGIINSPALVSVVRTTTSGCTIVHDDIINMYVAQENPESAYWLINSECYAQILKLAYADSAPSFMAPTAGIKDAPNGSLFGRPIIKCEQSSALGTVGDIMFSDLDDYWLVTKGGVRADMSIHVQFLTDQQAFRWVVRFGGRTRTRSTMTPYLGSVVTSPHVALAV